MLRVAWTRLLPAPLASAIARIREAVVRDFQDLRGHRRVGRIEGRALPADRQDVDQAPTGDDRAVRAQRCDLRRRPGDPGGDGGYPGRDLRRVRGERARQADGGEADARWELPGEAI